MGKKQAFSLGAVVVLAVVLALAYLTLLDSKAPEFSYRFPLQQDPSAKSRLDAELAKLKQDPENPALLASAASAYYSFGKRSGSDEALENAEKYAQASLSHRSFENETAALILAKRKADRHEFNEAIGAASKLIQPGGKVRFDAYALLITASLGIGELKKASDFADQLASLRPSAQSMALRALVEIEQGRVDEARFDFERALELEDIGDSEHSAWLRAIFARFLLSRGENDLARKLLDESLRISPNKALPLAVYGDLKFSEREHQSAKAYYNQAFDSSKDPVFLIKIAELRASEGSTAGESELCGQAEELLKASAKNIRGHRLALGRAIMCQTPPRLVEAISILSEEVNERPNSQSYFYLAKANGLAKRRPDATKAILAALRTGIRDRKFYELASEIFEADGNKRRAELYRELSRQN